jgi:hypothetical protein
LDTDQRKELTVVSERAVLVGVELNDSPVGGRESLRELMRRVDEALKDALGLATAAAGP